MSSFDHDALREMELVSRAELNQVRTVYLTNFYNHIEVPPLEQIIKMGDGLNIEFSHITREIVDEMHTHGKIVSVWIDCDVTQETPETWCKVFELGVDAYCTDHPLKVAQVWQNYKTML